MSVNKYWMEIAEKAQARKAVRETMDHLLDKFCELDDKVKKYDRMLRSSSMVRVSWEFRDQHYAAIDHDNRIVANLKKYLVCAEREYELARPEEMKIAMDCLEAQAKLLYHW